MNDVRNPFRFRYIGVERYLELHSKENFNDYCLSFLFTYRDFDNGVLGLAWVGSTEGINSYNNIQLRPY